ncbi:M28 family peptidase [Pseudonocardia benzenivorans]
MRSPTITPPPRPVAVAAAWLIVLVVTVVAVLSVSPPSPRTDVPAGEPSAAAAFAHVERIGAQTHVAGSAAADGVRTYILDTLRGLGIDARVQDAVGVHPGDPVQAARVRNVVATLPGTAPQAGRGRVLLVAHYDSVQVGPGANDDGAGVSTLLESARVLRTTPLRNDVVLLFTDAEEACLCGAEAFVASDPVAAQGGVVLNVEARGTGGPAIMFETTRGNARLLDVYADAVPHPVTTSFAVEVYRILPNDTDFSPFRDSGRFTGLNSAYIDRVAAYHSPQDTPSRMDRGACRPTSTTPSRSRGRSAGRTCANCPRPRRRTRRTSRCSTGWCVTPDRRCGRSRSWRPSRCSRWPSSRDCAGRRASRGCSSAWSRPSCRCWSRRCSRRAGGCCWWRSARTTPTSAATSGIRRGTAGRSSCSSRPSC